MRTPFVYFEGRYLFVSFPLPLAALRGGGKDNENAFEVPSQGCDSA